MTLKNLQEKLLAQLAVDLKPKGFKRAKQTFTKKISVGKQIFHIAFVERNTDFDVVADMAVRYDALEDLVNSARTNLSKREKLQTASIGCEIGNISGGEQKRWTVSGEADIAPVCSGILADFEAIALPYLEKYASLDEILSVLSGDDASAWLHSPLHGARAQKAVGAAYLLGQKDTFDKLVESKTAFLKERNDFGLSKFVAFANNLSENWK